MNSKQRRRVRKPCLRKAKYTEPTQDRSSCDLESAMLIGEEVGKFAMQEHPLSDLDSAMLTRTNGEEVWEFAMLECPSADLDSAMLLITNGEEVVEFGGHDDIAEKGESLASHSKRGSTTVPHENSNPQIIDADGVETIGGNDITACRKKITPKRRPKMPRCAEQSGEHLESTLNGNGVMSKKTARAPKRSLKGKTCADQSEEHLASSSQVDLAFDGNNAASNMKKRIPKLHPRRRIYIEESEHQASSARMESITSDQAVGTSGRVVLTEERASEPQMQVCAEPKENGIGTCLNGDSRGTVCKQDKPKRKRSSNKPNSEQSSGAIDVDPITPGCSLHDDEDDMTLACFIKLRLPKKRLKSAKNGDQGPKVSPLQQEKD